MISNEQRRRVAQRMRNEIHFMRLNQEWYETEDDAVECGNRAFRNIANAVIPYSYLGNDYIGVVERLADIIDRPTCQNVSGYKDTFECSECRCRVFSTPLMPRYCPNCGAEVVE